MTGKDTHLIGMLIAQVVLYFITNMPYIDMVLYGTITANIPESSKSKYRVTVETFAVTLSSSFFYYCYTAVGTFVFS